MAQIFPKWSNGLPVALVMLASAVPVLAVGVIWYFGSPVYTDVGYAPEQPVPFSHATHAGTLAMDCRYCHSAVEFGKHANVPPTQTCMNCHTQVLREVADPMNPGQMIINPKLAPIIQSWETGEPMQWVRVHKLPEYAYFNHAPHLQAGVGCQSCHGDIVAMDVVTQAEPLSMGWCLDCHRNPEQHLRPDDVAVTEMLTWKAGPDKAAQGLKLKEERNLNPPEDCSACHR